MPEVVESDRSEPPSLTSRPNALDTESGCIGAPSLRSNTRPVSIHAAPQASRHLACCTRCRRSKAIVWLAIERNRTSTPLRLGLTVGDLTVDYAQPVLHAELSGVKIHVGPAHRPSASPRRRPVETASA
jgi:hypothetical protein